LAYSTETRAEPPELWTSSWRSGTIIQIYPIPSELLSVAAVHNSAVQAAQATFQRTTITWNPVRLPTPASQQNAPFGLSYYFYTRTTSDSIHMTLGSDAHLPKAYRPEFHRAGVRWFYPGEDAGATKYPDLWIQRWQPEDISIDSQPSPNWKWVVYSKPRAENKREPYTVIAFTTADAATGDADAPPDQGWYSAADSSQLRFKPTRGTSTRDGAVSGVVTMV
jgi:hypothetical protein